MASFDKSKIMPRINLNQEEYQFIKGLAEFYYDQRVIPNPTVSAFAKFATIKAANEWMQIEEEARRRRQERQRVVAPVVAAPQPVAPVEESDEQLEEADFIPEFDEDPDKF